VDVWSGGIYDILGGELELGGGRVAQGGAYKRNHIRMYITINKRALVVSEYR